MVTQQIELLKVWVEHQAGYLGGGNLNIFYVHPLPGGMIQFD